MDLETLVLVVFVTCLGAFSLAVFLTFLQSWGSGLIPNDNKYIEVLEDATWQLVERNKWLENEITELKDEKAEMFEGGMELRKELAQVEEISDQQMKEIRLLEDKAEKYFKYWQQMAVERDNLQIRVRELKKTQGPPVKIWADLEDEVADVREDEPVSPKCEICGQPLEEDRKYTCRTCYQVETSYEEWLEGLAGE